MLSEGKWLEAIMLVISQLWSINWGGISQENVCFEEIVQLHEDWKYLDVGEVHGPFLEIRDCASIKCSTQSQKQLSPSLWTQPHHTNGSQWTSNELLKYF